MLVGSCGSAGAQITAVSVPDDFQIVPGKHVGPIWATTSEADLKRMFGSQQVTNKIIRGPEGNAIDATLIYPRTVDRLEVYWTDKTHTHIEAICVKTAGGRWRIGRICVGMSLSELVKRNACKAIRFSVFAFTNV